MSIKFGSKVKDKITGFIGIVTGKASYISGCSRILVEPPIDKDKKMREAEWIDENRIETVDNSIIKLDDIIKTSGPGKPAPKH